MKRLLTFLLAFAAVSVSVMAQQVSVDDALAKAMQLRQSASGAALAKGMGTIDSTPTLAYTASSASNATLYYAFNYPGGGFAIIGGDEVAKTVLGYSESGAFNMDSIPDGLKFMLNSYAQQIGNAMNAKAAGLQPMANAATAKEDVAPFVKTQWSQYQPFNNAIPKLAPDYDPFVTGCVATAMSQVMKYYEYPAKGTGSNMYNPGSFEYDEATNTWNFVEHLYDYKGSKMHMLFEADFSSATYDWKNMRNSYAGNDYSAAEADAVATLLYHAGVSVNMEYEVDGSGAPVQDIPAAMVEHFGYDKSIAYKMRDMYSDDVWENMVYKELLAKRPVIYGGQGTEGGHAFVLNGYHASDNTYYINWGWGGSCDGYYPITGTQNCWPRDNMGETPFAPYEYNHDMVINIMPDAGGKPMLELASQSQCFVGDKSDVDYTYTIDRSTATGNEMIVMEMHDLINAGGDTFDATKARLMFRETTSGKEYLSDPIVMTFNLGMSYYYPTYKLTSSAKNLPYNGTYDVYLQVYSKSRNDWYEVVYYPTLVAPQVIVEGGVDDPDADKPKPGDVNGDHALTLDDARLIMDYYLGKPVSNFYSEAADVDGDGKISLSDANAILNIILKAE